MFASLAAALGLAWLRDVLDPSIKSPLELARIAIVPLLTAIPYIETQAEIRAQARRAWLLGGLALSAVIAYLVCVHLFLKPLSEILESVLRRVPFL